MSKKGIDNINMDIDNYNYQLGYECFGPFLYGFCNWLHENVIEKKIDKIFFFARDGYIIKEAYEKIYGPSVNNKYFCLSRRSLMLPSMKGLFKYNDIIDSLILPPSFTVEILLNTLGLSIEKSDLENKYGISKNMVLYRDKYYLNKKIEFLIMDNILNLQEVIKQENLKFQLYMKQEKMEGDIAIVDIGWHNSIQNLLSKILRQENYKGNIYGFYVGVYDNAKSLPKNHFAYGYLYDQHNKSSLQYKTFSFVSLFESMFLAHEGTTVGYSNIENCIVPLKANYEYSKKKEMSKIIFDFQCGAIDFCSNAKKNNLKFLSKKQSYNRLIKLGMNPTSKEIDAFSKLEFENFTNNNLINFNHNTVYYLLHLKTLKNDFYKSGWRIVFLKKLIPFPFPHYLFFRLLCAIFIK